MPRKCRLRSIEQKEISLPANKTAVDDQIVAGAERRRSGEKKYRRSHHFRHLGQPSHRRLAREDLDLLRDLGALVHRRPCVTGADGIDADAFPRPFHRQAFGEVDSAGKQGRLDLAKELGADVALNFNDCDAVAEVMKLTKGYGCDVYIHNSGHPSGVVQGLKMIRKRGRFVEFSVFSGETSVDWSIIGDRKELDVYGSHISGPDGYPVAIDFLEKGIIRVDKIVTHVHPLKDWESAFAQAERGSDSIKVVLKPSFPCFYSENKNTIS